MWCRAVCACGEAPPRPKTISHHRAYVENAPCKGDGKDPPALKVTISPQQIVSNLGVCKILNTKPDGKSLEIHVECKLPAGPMIGDITFTQLPDKTVKLVDSEGNYNAVLHRCPG